METVKRIEQALERTLSQAQGPGTPPGLMSAMRYAVFPGGARVRPRLTLAVASACGDNAPTASDAAASAIELLHCASLIHDDLPCFDDAATRRGKPSVHRAFGEPLAVLAGDALIVLAFQALAQGAARVPDRLAALLMTIGGSVGLPSGIVAGQAWECEAEVDLSVYQQSKTGSLFAAATIAGAQAAGVASAPWRVLGERIGEAYQVADDIRDVTADPQELGKPVCQDALFDRPNAVHELGLTGAVKHLQKLIREGMQSIPDCPGAASLRALILAESSRFLPKELARRAA